MIRFSVVMTAYNEETRISRAIDSVLAQDYPEWELIIVDDGSTDNTWNIINSYASSDTRIIAVQQEHSGKCSTGRNNALNYITGDYMQILDADDHVKEDMLRKYAEKLSQYRYDAVVPIERLILENREKNAKCAGFENIVLTGTQAFFMSVKRTIHGHFCVRSDIIKMIRWDEEFFASDEITYCKMYYKSEKVAFADTDYYYCENENSSTLSLSNKTKMYYYLMVYFRLYEYSVSENMPEEARIETAGHVVNMLIDHKITFFRNKTSYTEPECKEIEYIHNYVASQIIKRLGKDHTEGTAIS